MALLVATAALASLGAAPAPAAWLGVSDLAAPNASNQNVGVPSIAVAPDGTAFAAFQHFDGAHLRAAVAMRSPGGGFGAVRDLSDATQDAFGPVIAVDRQGNATVAWLHSPDFTVQASFRPAGGDWGSIQTLSAATVFNGPNIAVGANGAAGVVWGRTTASPLVRVEAAVRPAGSPTFGGALFVSPNAGTGLCQPPQVAMDAAGDVAAIWTRRTSAGGDYHVESAVKAAGAAAFDPSEPRSSTTGNSDCNVDIHMTPGGRATAMWDFRELSAPTVSYVAYADRSAPFATGAWGAFVKLSAPTDSSTKPLFALDDAGNAGATWLSAGQILSAVRTGLGGFSPPRPLSGATDTKGQAVGASPNGDAMAAFVGMSNGSDAVFSARRTAGTEFGDVVPVATTPPGGATVSLDSPDIALDDQGNAFAVWRRTVNNTSSAQVAGYDPVPPAITAADVPAAGTAGQAVSMSAAASDRMSGAALHFDFGDGAGADGSAVQHIYGAAGAYTVTITATDGAGNRSSVTRSIQVAPAPGPGTGASKKRLRVAAVTALSWDLLSDGRTRLKSLVVERLSGPEKVRLSCTGKHKGCRKAATRTIKKHGRTLRLTKYVRGMTLRPKAQLTITVSRPGYISRIFRYTMVKRRDPKKATRCLAPGKKKSVACS